MTKTWVCYFQLWSSAMEWCQVLKDCHFFFLLSFLSVSLCTYKLSSAAKTLKSRAQSYIPDFGWSFASLIPYPSILLQYSKKSNRRTKQKFQGKKTKCSIKISFCPPYRELFFGSRFFNALQDLSVPLARSAAGGSGFAFEEARSGAWRLGVGGAERLLSQPLGWLRLEMAWFGRRLAGSLGGDLDGKSLSGSQGAWWSEGHREEQRQVLPLVLGMVRRSGEGSCG